MHFWYESSFYLPKNFVLKCWYILQLYRAYSSTCPVKYFRPLTLTHSFYVTTAFNTVTIIRTLYVIMQKINTRSFFSLFFSNVTRYILFRLNCYGNHDNSQDQHNPPPPLLFGTWQFGVHYSVGVALYEKTWQTWMEHNKESWKFGMKLAMYFLGFFSYIFQLQLVFGQGELLFYLNQVHCTNQILLHVFLTFNDFIYM
jgi:hypothetical protein